MKTQASPGLLAQAAGVAAVMSLLPFTAAATPAFNWDFQTYYAHAQSQPASLTSQQLASINQVDGYYPTSMVNATGPGLTQAELDEVAAMPAYFLLSRDPQSGELSGRPILLDDENAEPEPDTTQPAGFNGDFVTLVMRLTDLYAKATAAQAPQLEQVYSDLIEHFLNQNYLPGGQPITWFGNGYRWLDRGWKTLRMVHKLSADKRDLYSFNLAYASGFSKLMADVPRASTDDYYTGFPTAFKGLALMSDTPAKWQLMTIVRRGLDLSIIGQEGDPKNQLVPLDGSIIHHDQHNVHYAHYSYGGMLQTHINWTTAGFTSPSTAATVDRMRKGSLAWCFATAGGLNPLHQRSETELLAANAPSDGGIGNGLDFALKAARLKSAFDGTSIAGDLEMAYAAIAKTGVGNTSLPVEWRGITPPSGIDPSSPLYTASLLGNYSHTTNGTSILRGPGQWYASLRGQPTHWRGGESRYNMGTPTHFTGKAMHGSLMLITTGKNGRKPNEVDSGYFRDGWDYSYFPNVTCPEIPLESLLYWKVWAYFGGETNLTGSADLRDSGVWMMKGSNACKSAFMLGDRIVLVNNNITGSNLHTGLIQYGHNTPAAEPLVLDGSSQTADGDWTLSAGGNHKIVDAQGNGYFVHAGAGTPAIKAHRGNQSTTYALPENWIGEGPAPGYGPPPTYEYQSDFIANLNNFTPTTANFSKVWFDHGTSASNQAMEYTVLVKPQAGELDTYASAMANPADAPVKVTKTSKVHRYLDRASGTCAAAVFDTSEALQMHDLVSVNRPGAYIWRNKDGLLRLSVSSSETENTSAFQVTVRGEWTLESQEGTDNVTVTPGSGNTVVSLSYRQAAPQSVVLRRSGNNSPPTWFNPSLALANPSFGTAFSGSLAGEAIDADTGNTLTFAKISGPAWLNVSSNGTLSGTQNVSDGGVNVFTIRVTDSTGAYTDVTLTISANIPPVFSSPNITLTSAYQNAAYFDSLVVHASDANSGETLTYSKVSGPSWLIVNADGTLSGTPSASDNGTNTFIVRVTDGTGAHAEATVTIPVNLGSNGTWTNAAGGSWGSGANWSSSIVAGGADSIADFSTLNITSNATVTLDYGRTVGQLKLGDTTPGNNWSLNGEALTLTTTSGTPTILVNNGTATISAAVAGLQGFTKTGTGALSLTGSNTYKGLTTIGANSTTSGGTLTVSGSQSSTDGWRINNGTVNFQSGTTINVASSNSITTSSGTGNNLRKLNVAGMVANAGSLYLDGGATFNLNSGADWTQAGSMSVKSSSTFTSGILTVNSGAVFKYTGTATITLSASSGTNGGSGTLSLAGGTFQTGKGFVNSGGTAGSANLLLSNGGTLKLTADVATLASNSGTTTPFNIQVGTGGGIIDTNGFATTVTQDIANVSGQMGSLTKQGAGTLTLAGSNAYTGATTVTGGTLAGAGSFAGPIHVQAGGTLAPSGTLTVNNTLALAGSAQMKLTKTGATLANDKVSGVSTLTYGGALVVTQQGPDALAAGDSFQLFAATTYSGSFASITLPTLAPNLVWDASKLSIDGSIGVRTLPVAVADAVTTPQNTAATIAVLANDSDSDGDALSIQSVTQGAHGAVAIAGSNVTYTPAANWNGIDSFNYTITDNKEGTAMATVTVTVGWVNSAPVFTSNPINKPNATEDSAYAATLAGSATDVDAGQTLTYSKASGPAWLSVAANGAISGTPDNADVGAISFTVKVTDPAGANATATMNITVTNVNDAPVFTANPISGTGGSVGVAYTGTLAGSASDVDAGDSLTYSKVSGPAWLSVASDGALSGTPTSGDVGANSFTVRASDANNGTADAALNISVVDSFNNGVWVNLAGGSWLTPGNWNGSIIASGADKTANFGTLNITASATVTLDGARTIGGLTFGDTSSSHSWNLNAGSGGALTLDVMSGKPPIAVNQQSAFVNVVLAGTKGFTKNGGGDLVLGGANTYAGGTSIAAGTIRLGNSASNSVLGADPITFTGTSTIANGTSSAATIKNLANAIVINSGVTARFDGGWKELTLYGVISGAGNLAQTSSGLVVLANNNTYAGTTSTLNPSTLQVGNGGTTGAIGGGSVSLVSGSTLKFNRSNTYSVANVISGAGGVTQAGTGTTELSATNTYTGATNITAGKINLTGVLAAGAMNVNNTGTLAGTGTLGGITTVASGGTLAPGSNGIGTLTFNNTLSLAGTAAMEISKSGATLTADKVSGVTTVTYGGSLAVTNIGPDALVAGNTFQLFSATTYSGSFATINLPTLANGLVWNTSQLAINGSITVRALPVAANDSLATAEDVAGNFAVLTNDSDADNDTLAIQSVTQGAHGTVAINGPQVTYTPAANWSGTDSFGYTITDNKEGTATATVGVTVTSVNDVPVLAALGGSNATEDSAFSSSVAGAASDADAGDTLTFSKAAGPAWLSVASNGVLSGTPANGNVGANSFTIRVTDAAGAYAEQALSIAVANINDAPVFAANPINGSGATEDTTYVGTIAGNASDVDAGDSLNYSKVSGPAWLSVAANGALSGTPSNSDVGVNSFTVRASDANGGNANATLNIAVANVNDAPVFTANPLTRPDATAGQAYSGSIAGSASGIDAGDTLVYSKASGPAWLVVAANGALSGTPAATNAGSNSFTVRATDASGAFGSATLTIAVTIPVVDGTWINPAGGSWTTFANWTGAAMANGMDKTADFSTINLTSDTTVTLDGARVIGNLTFGDTTPSHNWLIAAGSGNPLTLDVSTGSPVITVDNQTATLQVPIAGSAGLTKEGAGTLVFSGTNTYSGLNTVSSGTLKVGGNHSAATGGWTITGGSVVEFLAGSAVTVASGNTILLTNSSDSTLNVAGTVVNLGGLTIRSQCEVNLNAGANWSQAGPLSLSPQNSGYGARLHVNGGSHFTYTGTATIALNSSTLNKNGVAEINIDGGTFTTARGFHNGTAGTGGTGTANLNFSNNGTLKLSADISNLGTTAGRPFKLQLGIGGGVIDTNGFSTTITQGITGTGPLTKPGSGTLTLSGPNTYSGATTIEGGTLAITGSLGNTTVDVRDAAMLSLAGNAGSGVTVRSNARLSFALAIQPSAQVARTIGGSLVFESGGILAVSATAAPALGDYVLATASSITRSPVLALPAGLEGSVAIVGNSLRVTITACDPSLFPTPMAQPGSEVDTAPEGDADHDGLPNLLELVLGSDVQLPNSSSVVTRRSGADLIVTFTRTDLSEGANLQLSVEAGPSLDSWPQVFWIGSSTEGSSDGVMIEENGSAPDTITVIIPSQGSPSLFARVKVLAGDQ